MLIVDNFSHFVCIQIAYGRLDKHEFICSVRWCILCMISYGCSRARDSRCCCFFVDVFCFGDLCGEFKSKLEAILKRYLSKPKTKTKRNWFSISNQIFICTLFIGTGLVVCRVLSNFLGYFQNRSRLV